jgi:hypothetical protein
LHNHTGISYSSLFPWRVAQPSRTSRKCSFRLVFWGLNVPGLLLQVGF